MPRPSHKEYFLSLLPAIASRGTCSRRQVACVITDREHKILATGYNGVPTNFDHCTDHPCLGAKDLPGQTDNCMAVHGEAAALLQCTDLPRAYALYCSNLPCFSCAKLIANTRICQVFAAADYADHRGLEVLLLAGCVVHVGAEVYGLTEEEA